MDIIHIIDNVCGRSYFNSSSYLQRNRMLQLKVMVIKSFDDDPFFYLGLTDSLSGLSFSRQNNREINLKQIYLKIQI